MEKGGHFAALEQPELLAREIREFFRPLREVGACGFTALRPWDPLGYLFREPRRFCEGRRGSPQAPGFADH
jgi:hypothetical protein